MTEPESVPAPSLAYEHKGQALERLEMTRTRTKMRKQMMLLMLMLLLMMFLNSSSRVN